MASLEKDIALVRYAVAFFGSAIKSGEAWTEICDDCREQAFAAIKRIEQALESVRYLNRREE